MRTLAGRRGFSFIELFFVIALIGLLLLIAIPKAGRGIQSSRVDRAASVVALSLERSFTLASRQRRPVVLERDPFDSMAIQVRDTTGVVYFSRKFGLDTEYQVDTLSFDPADGVRVSPFGVALPEGPGSMPLTVSIAAGPARRRITMSRAGLVRIER